MAKPLRIFVSSPRDVDAERRRAGIVIAELRKANARYFDIEPILWEWEPMLASGHFQDQITPPGEADIVVFIVWSRLGTPLPEKTERREYRGIDGRAPVTGTEWEFENALAAQKQRGAPDLLAYRKRVSPLAPLDDKSAKTEAEEQWEKLEEFWRRWFVDRGEFRAAFNEFTDLDGFEAKLRSDLRKLIERRIQELIDTNHKPTTSTWPEGSPFRGLDAYRFEHAPIFFGRSAMTKAAVEKLTANAARGRAFLLILGASGSGKSSLAQAGILPALADPGVVTTVGLWRRAVLRPGGHAGGPLSGLAGALAGAGALPELLRGRQDVLALARHLKGSVGDPAFSIIAALNQIEDAARARGQLLTIEKACLVVVIDQFEELFTASAITTEERTAFIHCLDGLAKSGGVYVLATMRSDYSHRATEVPLLLEMAAGNGRLDLLPATQDEIIEMIRRPAEAAGIEFETDPARDIGLDAILAAEAANEPGALPLLSFLLDELYKTDVREDRVALTFSSMSALGGLKGAIANRADAMFAALPANAQEAFPRVLRALVTVSRSGGEPTVRPAAMGQFAEGTPERSLIDVLLDPQLRLLVADGDGVTARVRLAHEALITHWKRARDQIAQDRDDLRTRAMIEEALTQYRNASAGQQRLYLLSDPQLAAAVDLARRWPEELYAESLEFIGASQRRAQLRQRLTIAASLVFALLALSASGLAFYANLLQQRAQSQRNQALVAQSHFLSDAADLQTAAGNATAGVLLALEAISDPDGATRRPFLPDVAKRLYAASNESRELATIPFNAHGEFSSNGSRILRQFTEYHWQLIDARNGKPVCDITSIERPITPLFSADMQKIGYTPSGHELTLLDASTCATASTLSWSDSGLDVSLRALNFDGSIAVVELPFSNLELWNTRDRVRLSRFRHPGGSFGAVAVSHDGKLIATGQRGGDPDAGNYSGKVVLLSGNGALLKVLGGRYGGVHILQFSPDGRRLVSATKGSAVCCDLWSEVPLWDMESGELVRILKAHERSMKSVVFSRDSRWLLTASADGKAQLWNAANGETVGEPIQADNALMVSATFSPDSRKLLVAAADGMIWIRDLSHSRPDAVIRPLGDTALRFASFVADPDLAVSLSDDGTLRIWDARLGRTDVQQEEESLTVRKVLQGDRPPYLNERNQADFDNLRLGPALNIEIDRDQLIERVRTTVPRCLTLAEREKFYLPPEFPDWCVQLNKWPAGIDTIISSGAARLRNDETVRAQVDRDRATARDRGLEKVVARIQSRDSFDKAQSLLLSGKSAQAEIAFAAALALDPTLSNRVTQVKSAAPLARARNLLREDWPETAIQEYEAYLGQQPEQRSLLAPEIAHAYSDQAGAALRHGELDKALALANKAIEMDPRLAWAYINRANVNSREGEAEPALADLRIAREIETDLAAPYVDAGNIYLERDHIDDAIASFTRAAEIAPANFYALKWKGYALFIKGSFSEAAASFARSTDLFSSDHAMLHEFIASARAGHPSLERMKQYNTEFNSKTWPKLFMGTLMPQQLLDAAKGDKDSICDAHYYSGHWHLLQGNRDLAEGEFRSAAQTCSPISVEFTIARAELSRLGSTP